MHHDSDTCPDCGDPLDNPFAAARGHHRDCAPEAISK